MNKIMMPVVFAGHGSPMNTIEENRFTREWERAASFLPKPKAVLAISAHWYTHGLYVNNQEKPKQIFDMYGFPEELYQVRYEPQGSPELAAKTAELLGAVPTADWGIDHGTWSVLRRFFPDADIPVVQLSVNADADPEEQFETGRKLAELRKQGILIFGSGSIVHNLAEVDWTKDDGTAWCKAFDKELKNKILAKDFAAAVNYRKLSTCRREVFLTPEHYYPLLTVLGAASEGDEVQVFAEGSTLGAISMTSYLIRQKEQESRK